MLAGGTRARADRNVLAGSEPGLAWPGVTSSVRQCGDTVIQHSDTTQ